MSNPTPKDVAEVHGFYVEGEPRNWTLYRNATHIIADFAAKAAAWDFAVELIDEERSASEEDAPIGSDG